jgi:hypothetical protein
MVQRDFIPYEQALELKELGFDEPCLGKFYYNHLEIGGNWRNDDFKEDPDIFISAPLYQQVFRWFRDKYGIVGYCYIPNETGYWGHSFENKAKYDTYEEAEIECIKELISIVKNNEKN